MWAESLVKLTRYVINLASSQGVGVPKTPSPLLQDLNGRWGIVFGKMLNEKAVYKKDGGVPKGMLV